MYFYIAMLVNSVHKTTRLDSLVTFAQDLQMLQCNY